MLDSNSAPHLDHLFLTVDEGTFADISNSEVLKDDSFSRFLLKKAESTLLGPYETINILGENTFVEFFPKTQPPFPGVTLGMVLSFDTPGESLKACQAFVESGEVGFDFELNRRRVIGKAELQRWYRLIRPKLGPDAPFTLFLSEITTEYFDAIGAERSADGGQPRSAYLNAAAGKSHRSDHRFRDITKAKLRLAPERATLVERTFLTLGYVLEQSDQGLLFRSPEATIVVVVANDEPEGLLELTLELSTPDSKPGRTILFGQSSRLCFSPGGHDDATAVWSFTPLRTIEVIR